MSKQQKHKKLRTSKLKCSDCKRVAEVTRLELRRAARVRCTVCGGPMNWKRFVPE